MSVKGIVSGAFGIPLASSNASSAIQGYPPDDYEALAAAINGRIHNREQRFNNWIEYTPAQKAITVAPQAKNPLAPEGITDEERALILQHGDLDKALEALNKADREAISFLTPDAFRNTSMPTISQLAKVTETPELLKGLSPSALESIQLDARRIEPLVVQSRMNIGQKFNPDDLVTEEAKKTLETGLVGGQPAKSLVSNPSGGSPLPGQASSLANQANQASALAAIKAAKQRYAPFLAGNFQSLLGGFNNPAVLATQQKMQALLGGSRPTIQSRLQQAQPLVLGQPNQNLNFSNRLAQIKNQIANMGLRF